MPRRPLTSDEKIRAKERADLFWSNPANIEQHRKRMARPSVRAKISERTAAAHTPDMKARKDAALKRAYTDPAVRQRVSEATKAGMARHAERLYAGICVAWKAAPKAMRERFLREVAGQIGGPRRG